MLTTQFINDGIEDRRQLFLTVTHKQFGFQQRIDHPDMFTQRIGADAAVMDQDTGHQRRQYQHMQNVIPVVGHQYRIFTRQNDDIPEAVFLNLELVHLQCVFQQFFRTLRRGGAVRGIRHIAQQLEIAVELFDQLFAGQCALTGSQQSRGTQVDSIRGGGIIDAHHNVISQRCCGWCQPGRTLRLDRVDRLTPFRYLFCQVL